MIPIQPPIHTNFQPSPTPTGDTMPDPIKVSAPAPKPTNVEDEKTSTADKVQSVGKILAKDVQQGLSYANARRARETYRPVAV